MKLDITHRASSWSKIAINPKTTKLNIGTRHKKFSTLFTAAARHIHTQVGDNPPNLKGSIWITADNTKIVTSLYYNNGPLYKTIEIAVNTLEGPDDQ